MRLGQEDRSTNIEDRRGTRVSPGLATGGIGTIAIILIGLFLGIDPSVLLQGNPSVDTTLPPYSQQSGANDEMGNFVSRVLGSTERTWSEIFQLSGREYQPPKLVLFSGSVQSACGLLEQPRVRFIARKIIRYTSISTFIENSVTAFTRPVILRRPMSLHTRSVIMSKINLAL
jgi:predicted metalloprotease